MRVHPSRFVARRVGGALLAFALVLLLGACGSRRDTMRPVSWNADAVRADTSRVGVVMRELPDREANYPGARCLACRPLAAANNAALKNHVATLDGREELQALRGEVVALLKNRGVDAIEITDALDVEAAPAEGEITTLPPEVEALRTRHRLGRLIVFEFESLGVHRPYVHYVAAAPPYGVVEGRAYMLDLTGRKLLWNHPMRSTLVAEGEWDEAPDYPGLSNAYYQAIEKVKDRIKQIVAPAPAGQLATRAAPAPASAEAPSTPAAATATNARIALNAPADKRVAWSGLIGPVEGDPDSATTMPAFGVIGIFVSAARGATVESGQQDAARKRQQEADRVLEPVRAALDRHDSEALWKDTLAALGRTTRIAATIVDGNMPAARDAWSVDVQPRFALAHDLHALVLDAVVGLRPPGATAAEPVKTAVRVVSPPGRGDTWTSDDARALKAEAATMLAHAVEQALWLAQRDAAAAAAPQRTHRYPLAAELRAERGSLLREGCARMLIRTLRKGLLSAPRPQPAAGCDSPYRL